MRRGLNPLPEAKATNINDLSSSSSSSCRLNRSQTNSVADISLLAIEDGVDEEEFERTIHKMVASIHAEMRSFGDAEQDVNDLRNVEFRIQSERIVYLLDACVENVQFGFVMPLLLADKSNRKAQEMIGRILPSELLKIKEVFDLISTMKTDTLLVSIITCM